MESLSSEKSYTAELEAKNWKFIHTICRLCSTECQLKSENILQKKVLEMLDYCFSLGLSQSDRLPKRICTSCIESLEGSYIFKKKVESTDAWLKEKFKTIIPKQDILDIALNQANIKNGQATFSKDISTSGYDILEVREFNEINVKNPVNHNNSLLNYSDLKQNKVESEERKKVEEGSEKYNVKVKSHIDVPPLVPIKPVDNSEKNASNQVTCQEPPPLLPLKTIRSEPLSSKPTDDSLVNKESKKCILLDKPQGYQLGITESSKLLFCNICKKEFKDGKKLIGHLKGHVVPKNFACKICDKKYPNPSTFQIHMRSHTGERPFKCLVCSKGFTRWAGVVSHMQTHEDNRPFKCDSCNQSFKILSNLERHKVLHSEVLPFCCKYCGKTFSQSTNLQLHIRTYHTNERPYLCSECGKGFVSSTRLNRHMWVHTGYKPFLCKICSKAYSNSGDLRNHESGAHGDGECEKPYACTLCDKRFFYSCRLSKHLKTHQRPYACDKCCKSFCSSDTLEQHMISKHTDVSSTNNRKSKIL